MIEEENKIKRLVDVDIQTVGDYSTKYLSLEDKDHINVANINVANMDEVSRGMYYHWIKGTGM